MQLGLAVQAFDFALEALDHLLAVQAEVLGVAAHEADRVGRAGQVLVLAALDGVEIGVADAEHFGDGAEVLADLLACPDQGIRYGFALQFLRDGDLGRVFRLDQPGFAQFGFTLRRFPELGLFALTFALFQRVCHGFSQVPDWGLRQICDPAPFLWRVETATRLAAIFAGIACLNINNFHSAAATR